MTAALRLGTFDAERSWRPADLARLPEMTELASSARTRVAAMDEVLAGMCAPGDTLVTRRPMDAELLSVLADAGLRFANHAVAAPRQAVPEQAAPDPVADSVVELFATDPAAPRLLRVHRLTPYAVTGPVAALADAVPGGSPYRLPAVVDVARVNSKTWSNELVGELGLPGAGVSVFSTGELAVAVADAGFPAVVKDPFGVSGSGALAVPSPGVLRAITRTLDRQVADGKRVELLVQPHYVRRHDVSGHGELTYDGGWRWLGLCSVRNRGFRFTGAGPADDDVAPLEPALRAVADEVARRAYAAGYWGPLSIDSMVLADGTLVPVLEVNARVSLGRLTLDVDRTCAGEPDEPARCHLWQIELTAPPEITTGRLLHALRRDGLLYRLGAGNRAGCVPLGGVPAAAGQGGPERQAAPVIRWHCVLRCLPGEVSTLRERVLASLASVGLRQPGLAHAA